MLNRCDSCPGLNGLVAYLHEVLDDDVDENELIIIKQWVTTDRADIVSLALSLPDYIDHLAKQIDDLTAHSYIAKCQAAYLKNLKETLPLGEAIVMLDFAENYAFIVQDEVQGYHWNKSQCTLHPVMLYYPSY